VFLLACMLLATARGAGAAPFDVVVPQEIRVDTTSPAFKVRFEHWGWIAATGDSLGWQDLEQAVLTADFETAAVAIDQGGFENLGSLAPLLLGEVAGLRLDPGNAAAYDSLLLGGETLKAPSLGLFPTTIVFPEGYADTATVTATITMAGEELEYTTTVIFGEFGLLRPEVTVGQRVSSVPIPAPAVSVSWGALKARFLEP
jgi:hypothetical protein